MNFLRDLRLIHTGMMVQWCNGITALVLVSYCLYSIYRSFVCSERGNIAVPLHEVDEQRAELPFDVRPVLPLPVHLVLQELTLALVERHAGVHHDVQYHAQRPHVGHLGIIGLLPQHLRCYVTYTPNE